MGIVSIIQHRIRQSYIGENMNREEHLQWSKNRALEYVDAGDLEQALASMFSDLGKHDDLANHAGIELGIMLMMSGQLSTAEKVREFIVGFN